MSNGCRQQQISKCPDTAKKYIIYRIIYVMYRIVSLLPFYRCGGGSAQLLLQPRLLGLLELSAGRGVIEQLGVQNQAEDSTHLREQENEETKVPFMLAYTSFFFQGLFFIMHFLPSVISIPTIIIIFFTPTKT